MTVRRFLSNSSRETIEIGGEIAQLLSAPTLLFLRGDLGVRGWRVKLLLCGLRQGAADRPRLDVQMGADL